MKEFKGIVVIGERSIFNELSQKIEAVAAQANEILEVMYKYTSNGQLLMRLDL